MALLSADDVLNKRFQPTKFREGYDQDEVDDFLDEVVNTLRAVAAENDELKAKLAACENRVAELSRGEGAPAPAPVQQAPVAPEPEPAPVPVAAAAPAPAAKPTDGPESAAGMLALAQRLHDEYVRNGQEEGERIIADARSQGEQLVREAEAKRDQTLQQLEGERTTLERKIDELRNFEREYRSRLKSYLEGLLADVDQRGNVSAELGQH
ncbi:MAG: DivIVA domain-containing protein [Actinomycetales bacterium]|jgi:DivIVA domain|nr:DivIVA domain-containing protein [Actinomycetales bacterium]